MNEQWKPSSIFQVEGVAVRDAYQGATFSYVTIQEGEKSFWDVACFEDGPLDQFRTLRSGAAVKVRGHLAKRKMRDGDVPVVDSKGRPRWEIQLIAEKIKALAPLVPAPRAMPPEGKYQLPLGQRAMTYPEWLAMQPPQQLAGTFYQGGPPQGLAARPNHPNPGWPDPNQPNMPPLVTQGQAGAEHPASFDAFDPDIPF
jgi:hypothetical protein